MRTFISATLLIAIVACATSLEAQETQAQEKTKTVKQTPSKKTTDQKTPGKAAAKKKPAHKWIALFNGKDLKGWEKPKGYDYEEAGKVVVKNGSMVLPGGVWATGIRRPGKFPTTNYEVQFEARRVDGYDFFGSVTFPVGKGSLTLVLGGWGGMVTGLSDVDGYSAIDNETCGSVDFQLKQWYRVRVRVTDTHVIAHVDDEEICTLEREHRKLVVRDEMKPCLPFGFATWDETTGEVRKVRYRMLSKQELIRPKKDD